MLKIPRLNIGLSLFMEKKQIGPNEENMSDLNIAVTHPFRRTINVDEIHLVDDVHDQSITLCKNFIFLLKFRCFVK